MAGIIVIFFRNYNKLSSHMAHILDPIIYQNHKIHSYDQMRKNIVNLGSNKCKNNNNSPQLTHIQNFVTYDHC